MLWVFRVYTKIWGFLFSKHESPRSMNECPDELEINHEIGLNHGITSDKNIIVNNQSMLRRIVCVDPQIGKGHILITFQLTISPDLVMQLYRLPWDIKKVFDEFKIQDQSRSTDHNFLTTICVHLRFQ
jgi:hypothetical protein